MRLASIACILISGMLCFFILSQSIQSNVYLHHKHTDLYYKHTDLHHKHTNLRYFDTLKLEADLNRAVDELDWMHNTVMEADDVLCHANPDSHAFAARQAHVAMREKLYFEKVFFDVFRTLAEMQAVLAQLEPDDGDEVRYILMMRYRVRKARDTAFTLLKKAQLQVEDLEAACAWVMTA